MAHVVYRNPGSSHFYLSLQHTKRILSLLLVSFFLTSCITTYSDFPVAMIGKQPESKPYSTLYYHIKKFPVIGVGGQSHLRSIFRDNTPFKNTEKVTEVPKEGIYCLVQVEWKTPSVPAVVFGYISLSFLTFLPAWSQEEGYIVNYHLFVDGEKKKIFDYEISRKTGMWVVLLPFIWVNLMTPSEAEAFEATAYQFFEDAKPIFLTSNT
ncbi:MAG: hypothetical protein ACE5HN_00625 [Nitrospiria bacterium]